MSSETTFWDAVDALRARDTRYAREAYGFVAGALSATVRTLPSERQADAGRRHLSGRELLDGMVRIARAEFGPLAPTVFREWGVLATEDVGAIVFELVQGGQLSARPEDTAADFAGAFDLLGALASEPGGGPSRPGSAGSARPRLA